VIKFEDDGWEERVRGYSSLSPIPSNLAKQLRLMKRCPRDFSPQLRRMFAAVWLENRYDRIPRPVVIRSTCCAGPTQRYLTIGGVYDVPGLGPVIYGVHFDFVGAIGESLIGKPLVRSVVDSPVVIADAESDEVQIACTTCGKKFTLGLSTIIAAFEEWGGRGSRQVLATPPTC
jgi:hypothetical protein